jgi:hypothetical protein
MSNEKLREHLNKVMREIHEAEAGIRTYHIHPDDLTKFIESRERKAFDWAQSGKYGDFSSPLIEGEEGFKFESFEQYKNSDEYLKEGGE